MTVASSFPSKTIAEWRGATQSFGDGCKKAENPVFIDRKIPARDGHLLDCRIFNSHLPENSPVFIFYPGCAFLFDFFEVNGRIASRIAEKSEIKVVLVQHRLAPENSILTCLNDCFDGADFIAHNAQSFGIDSDKLFIGGWCSGANAATYVSKVAQTKSAFKIQRQILLSGCFDFTHSLHEFDAYEAKDTTVKRDLIAHLAKSFYNRDSKDPLISPYCDTGFDTLTKTTLIFGEFDALRNDSEVYFEKLKKGSVPVEKVILEGQTHNEVVMATMLSDPAEEIAKILKQKLK